MAKAPIQSYIPVKQIRPLSFCSIRDFISVADVNLGYIQKGGISPKLSGRRFNVRKRDVACPIRIETISSVIASDEAKHLKVSFKEKMKLAAAACRVVLYLAETRRISDEWNKDLIHIAVIQSEAGNETLSTNLCLKYSFPSITKIDPNHASSASAPDEFKNIKNIIPNQIVFELGILLIELALQKPFHRPQSDRESNRWESLDDYGNALERVSEVYLMAMSWYGDAVKRCIKCSFDGDDAMQKFDFSDLRKAFHHNVVTLVEARYATLPG